MRKINLRKLTLHRETLSSLPDLEAIRARGGVPVVTAGDVCTLGCAATDYCTF